MAPIKEWAFLKAAKHGPARVIRYLLPKFEDDTDTLVNALHLAVDNHQPEVVRLLLGSDTPVDAINPKGYTALHIAACRANVVMIKMLLGAGADINAVTPRGDTALHLVAGNYRQSVTPRRLKRAARELIKNDAAQNIQNQQGNTALHSAIFYTDGEVSVKNYEIMDMLLKSRPRLTMKNHEGHTPLAWATLHNCEGIMALEMAEAKAGIGPENNRENGAQGPVGVADSGEVADSEEVADSRPSSVV